MPLDTCINNVGEYFSAHYLETTFAKDVKEQLALWNQQGSQSPPRRLQNLSQLYFREKTQALDELQPIRRQMAGDEIRTWHSRLLEALAAGGSDELYDYTRTEDGERDREEFWLDYMADTGDGWNSTYALAYWISRPNLVLPTSYGARFETRAGDVLLAIAGPSP